MEFLTLIKEKMKLVEMDQALTNRPLNEGFSGGEKKRNEILQMAVLDPRLAILDETDSGLDIDALRVVAGGVNALRSGPGDDRHHALPAAARLYRARISSTCFTKDGLSNRVGKNLALELEAKGYDWIKTPAASHPINCKISLITMQSQENIDRYLTKFRQRSQGRRRRCGSG